jgi:hypothetical protein
MKFPRWKRAESLAGVAAALLALIAAQSLTAARAQNGKPQPTRSRAIALRKETTDRTDGTDQQGSDDGVKRHDDALDESRLTFDARPGEEQFYAE